jgi:hypothetical protein
MKTTLILALLIALLFLPARGHEIDVGSTVVCNTAKRVEKYVAFNKEKPRTAVELVMMKRMIRRRALS